MKRSFAAMALLAALAMCLSGCEALPPADEGGELPGGNQEETPGGNQEETPGGNQGETPSEEQLLEFHRYDLKTYLTPLWEGKTVYNETLWFAAERTAPLLYTPDEIVSVMSYDLKTTYKEGVDYTWEKGERNISLTEGSSIPYMSEEDYYPAVPGATTQPRKSGGYVYSNEGADISRRQIVVTYTHSDEGDWVLPYIETKKFPATFEKLEKGEALNVVFYGDSITVGANSSGYFEVDLEPHAESYPEMVCSYLHKRYPAAEINYINTALGGTDSGWGANADNFKNRVLDKSPDLLFLAFGMNDAPSAEVFRANIGAMIAQAREKDPDVEIMLLSCMNANPETGFCNKDYAAFQNALLDLSDEYEHVGVATVYDTVKSVYGMGKRFRDCTGNNINHPNDFMARLYAQTVVCALCGNDYIKYI